MQPKQVHGSALGSHRQFEPGADMLRDICEYFDQLAHDWKSLMSGTIGIGLLFIGAFAAPDKLRPATIIASMFKEARPYPSERLQFADTQFTILTIQQKQFLKQLVIATRLPGSGGIWELADGPFVRRDGEGQLVLNPAYSKLIPRLIAKYGV
jgi:hypothetical protein